MTFLISLSRYARRVPLAELLSGLEFQYCSLLFSCFSVQTNILSQRKEPFYEVLNGCLALENKNYLSLALKKSLWFLDLDISKKVSRAIITSANYQQFSSLTTKKLQLYPISTTFATLDPKKLSIRERCVRVVRKRNGYWIAGNSKARGWKI